LSAPIAACQVLAPDVVEEDVDAVRRRLRQLLGDRPVLVVERRVVAVLDGQH
jgi:hypothetical protein